MLEVATGGVCRREGRSADASGRVRARRPGRPAAVPGSPSICRPPFRPNGVVNVVVVVVAQQVFGLLHGPLSAATSKFPVKLELQPPYENGAAGNAKGRPVPSGYTGSNDGPLTYLLLFVTLLPLPLLPVVMEGWGFGSSGGSGGATGTCSDWAPLEPLALS